MVTVSIPASTGDVNSLEEKVSLHGGSFGSQGGTLYLSLSLYQRHLPKARFPFPKARFPFPHGEKFLLPRDSGFQQRNK